MAGTPLALERSYGCLNCDFWDFGDGQDGRRGISCWSAVLFASVERVVCWGAIGWDVFGGGIAGRIQQSFLQCCILESQPGSATVALAEPEGRGLWLRQVL